MIASRFSIKYSALPMASGIILLKNFARLLSPMIQTRSSSKALNMYCLNFTLNYLQMIAIRLLEPSQGETKELESV